jgi:putative transposase
MLSTNTVVDKNTRIRESVKATRDRRKHMICRTFELKINRSKLSKQALGHLQNLFVEAKWFINAIIGSDNIFQFNDKLKAVAVVVKDKNNLRTEVRQLTTLSSQMKQGLLNQVQEDVRSLVKKKKNGHYVGRLKYKKVVRTIPLKQYNITYKLKFQKLQGVRIQGLKRWIKVRGLKQLPVNADHANAKLLQKQEDYYLHVTVYLPLPKPKLNPDPSPNSNPTSNLNPNSNPKQTPTSTTRVNTCKTAPDPATPTHKRNPSIGIDGGITHQLTLSNGIQLTYNLPISKQLRRTYRKLSRKTYGSKNYEKTLGTLKTLFDRWTNRKQDVINKLVHVLTTHYQIICYQKDNIKGWQRLFGTKLLNTALGELFVTLDKRATTIGVVDQWEPTTKRCALCHSVLPQPLPLSEKIFVCSNASCHWTADRDWNATLVIEELGLRKLASDPYPIHFPSLPTECRNVKPLETKTSLLILNGLFQRIPFVSSEVLSMNEEAQSF